MKNSPVIKMAVAAVMFSAWTLARVSAEPIQFNADYAFFRYNNQADYVEVYYSVENRSGLTMFLRIERNDSAWAENRWLNDISGTLDSNKDVALGRAYFLAPEGRYAIHLSANDSTGSLSDTTWTVETKPIAQSLPSLSDIELCSGIDYSKQPDAQNPFLKNGLLVIPKPSGRFSTDKPLLYYYTELYGLDQLKTPFFQISVQVSNSKGEYIAAAPKLLKRKEYTQESLVDYGEIGLFGVQTGYYLLKVTLEDSNSRPICSKTKLFEFDANQPVRWIEPVQIQFENSKFALLDLKQLEREYKVASYMMNDDDKHVYKNLTNVDSRRLFLFNFWRNRDADPSIDKNQSYESIMDRIAYADQHFGSMGKEGWKTDRGRVILLYGLPDDVERFPSTSENVPYEIWHYDAIEGGVIFVFADLSSFNNFVIVHSTKRGENNNPDYETMLKRGY